MALGTPNVYPSVLSQLGVAREFTAGTAVSPTVIHPVEQNNYEPEDMPKFLDDKAIRGSMTDLFYKTLGVESSSFSFGGPNFLDTHGYFMDNIFGDLSTTCNTLTTPATVSGTIPVGAVQFTLGSAPPAGWTAGAYIQMGTALTANTPACYANEVLLISSTAPSNVINILTTPVRLAHPSVVAGSTVAGSTVGNLATGTVFTHRFAPLNSALGYGGAYGAQPPTHTFTDVTNIVNLFTNATYGTAPSNTFGARAYPSGVLKTMDFSGNAEQLLNVKMAGDAWLSTVSSAAVTAQPTNSRPIPNWNTTVVIAGNTVSSSGAFSGIGEFNLSVKRATQTYWIVAGTQTPFIIGRGPITMDGTVQWDPTNTETPLDLMLLNAQAPMSITTTNSGIPNSGTPFTLTFTMSQVANIKSKIMRSKLLIGYGNSYEAVANSIDIGGSGGLSPGSITLVNATPTY